MVTSVLTISVDLCRNKDNVHGVVDEDGDADCGWIVGSVQRVVLGVTLTTKARGECYRLLRHVTHVTYLLSTSTAL